MSGPSATSSVRVTDRQLGGLGREPLDVVVVEPLVHDVPARGHADLALVEERPNAARVTAWSTSASSSTSSAELPPSSRCARLRWRPASSPTLRPAAVEPVNEMTRIRVGDHRLADGHAAREHLQDARRQARLFEDAGDGHAAGDGRTRVGLEHDGVAQREGGRHRPDAQDDRDVER